MEQWNKGNKMIRRITDHEDPTEYLSLMEERLRAMETQAGTHITWYTHKNPYGCWICDMSVLAQRLIDSFREFLGPTAAGVMEASSTSSEPVKNTSTDDEEDVELEEEG